MTDLQKLQAFFGAEAYEVLLSVIWHIKETQVNADKPKCDVWSIYREKAITAHNSLKFDFDSIFNDLCHDIQAAADKEAATCQHLRHIDGYVKSLLPYSNRQRAAYRTENEAKDMQQALADYKKPEHKEFCKTELNTCFVWCNTILKAYLCCLDSACLLSGIDLYGVCAKYGLALPYEDGRLISLCKGGYIVPEQRAAELIGKYIGGGQGVKLPKELATDEAKKLLDKAKAAGFLDDTYKWTGTNQLAAYFADRASKSLNLPSKQDSQGNKTTCWKPFEGLWGMKPRTLSTAYQNYMRTETSFRPKGYKEVNKVFET